jgi:hypothetical protein
LEVLEQSRIKQVDFLIKAQLQSPAEKLYILIYLILKTVTKIQVAFAKENKLQSETDILNTFITKVLQLLIEDKEIIDKSDLVDKYNRLRSDERADRRLALLNKSEEEKHIYLQRAKYNLITPSEQAESLKKAKQTQSNIDNFVESTEH